MPADGDLGAAAFGAARLGMIAASGVAPSAVMAPSAISETIEHDLALRDGFDAAYALYPALRALGGNHQEESS